MRSLIGKRAKPACPGERCRYISALPSLASLILPMAIAVCHPAMADERVGVNSAVNPAGTGTPPGAAPRQLMIGALIPRPPARRRSCSSISPQ